MVLGTRSFYKSQRSDVLKLIALITMLIDHIGYMFFEEIRLFRTIGRIAFPIFAYQLAMGFKHTSSRVRYCGRLAIFSVISYLPYIFFDPQLEMNPWTFSIMFQLLLGFIMLQLLEWGNACFNDFKSNRNPLNIVAGFVLYLMVLFTIVGPDILQVMFKDFHFSYGTYGMLLMLMFYLFEHRVIPVFLSFAFITVFANYIRGGVYFLQGIKSPLLRLDLYFEILITRYAEIWDNIMHWNGGLQKLEGYFFQARSVMALPLIMILPRLGLSLKLPTYLAYWFYPVHITLLVILKWLMR